MFVFFFCFVKQQISPLFIVGKQHNFLRHFFQLHFFFFSKILKHQESRKNEYKKNNIGHKKSEHLIKNQNKQ